MCSMTLRQILFLLMASTVSTRSQDTLKVKEASKSQLDVLVVAPHPDNEMIGCSGILIQALEKKKRVAIVVITNGDGHPNLTAAAVNKERDKLTTDDFKQAGALRQMHSVTAAARLGVPDAELMFLGYPDSGLEKIYLMVDGSPLRQMFTQQRETYGLTVPDYHTRVHGKSAPYLKGSIIGDLAEIIRTRSPKEIYVTHEADTHGDHRAAFWLVRDAILAAGHQGDFFTYLVHGKDPPVPPTRRVKLTPAQFAIKRAAIMDHQKGTSPVHDHLADEYAKPEEIFWQVLTQ